MSQRDLERGEGTTEFTEHTEFSVPSLNGVILSLSNPTEKKRGAKSVENPSHDLITPRGQRDEPDPQSTIAVDRFALST